MGVFIERFYWGISFSISSLITFLCFGFCHYETSYMVYSDKCYEVTWDDQNGVSICCSSFIDCQHYCSLFWDAWLLPTYKLRDFYSMKEMSDGIRISDVGLILSIGNWTVFSIFIGKQIGRASCRERVC